MTTVEIIHTGGKALGERKNQEDHYEIYKSDQNYDVVIVADGMGGHANGEEAAKIAVETLANACANIRKVDNSSLDLNLVVEAFYEAHNKVDARGDRSGTTLLVAIFDRQTPPKAGPAEVHIFWCGDSIAYIAPANGKAAKVTRPHTYWGATLSSCIGGGMHRTQIKVESNSAYLYPGDRVYLTTDGVSDAETHPGWKDLSEFKDGALAAEYFGNLRNGKHRQDNATCVISEVKVS